MFLPLVLLLACASIVASQTRPNIVFIIADDLGYNDVSWHGSDQIPTPNLDVLASSGVALHRYYSHALCTPSRTAILTGKYAYRTGMQGYPLTSGEARGIPLTEKLFPEYFKDLGYATHLVGKWHVGAHQYAYLPTFRGYDTFFGNKGGFIDFYEYTLQERWSTGNYTGLDLYRNVTADWASEGYVTDLYTNEATQIIKDHDTSTPLLLTLAHADPHSSNNGALLQADPKEVRAMRHIEEPNRRIYAAKVKKVDDSVGDVVEALAEKGILGNTIIVFVADNGGPSTGLSENWSSNLPLRGAKQTPFEGGIRVAGLIWSPHLDASNNLWKGYMHAVDWIPTLLGAVGADTPTEIDGINLWNNILVGGPSERTEIVEIDDYSNFSSIIIGDYKLVVSDSEIAMNGYTGVELQEIIGQAPNYFDKIEDSKTYKVFRDAGMELNPQKLSVRNAAQIDCGDKEFDGCSPRNGTWCLYNVSEDPCEKQDISATYSTIAQELYSRLQAELASRIPRSFPLYRNPRALPRYFNYTWAPWNEPSLQSQ